MRRLAILSVLRRIAVTASILAGACGDATAFRPPPADPPRGERIPFRRVGAGALYIGDAGVLVVRDAESWRTLWKRFDREGREPRPAVDFAREMVAAVSLGGMSGCSPAASYVWRVERGRDSLHVIIAYDGYPAPIDGVTCAMVIAPVDLVVLPRSDLPVVFRGYVAGFRTPPPARWIDRPKVAETDTIAPHWRDLYRLFIARDSATAPDELARLIDRLDEQGTEDVYGSLLEHPGVQADLDLLMRLVQPNRASDRVAQVLLERHGARLARDPGTEREVLRLLLWRLDREQEGYREVAASLIRHPTVLGDRQLVYDAYRYLLRKHITCAEGQRLWNRLHPHPPRGEQSAVCQPWDDSPRPPGLVP